MALVKVSEILKMADEANTAVIAFNCVDYSQVHAVCTVAEELGKPVLIALYPGHSTNFMCTIPECFAPMAIYEANRVSVPVGLHLDHCSDMDYIKRAIDLGFSSIMYDGSALPMEEMAQIMQSLRQTPPADLCGRALTESKDYLTGVDGLPKSDVLKFMLEDNCSVVIRPSGTEPKLKAYISVSAKNKDAMQDLTYEFISAVTDIMA